MKNKITVIITGNSLPPSKWLDMVDPRIQTLTRRECFVLSCLRDALANKEISDRMGISIETVKQIVKNLSRKTGLRNRVELAIFADRNCYPPGFIDGLIRSGRILNL